MPFPELQWGRGHVTAEVRSAPRSRTPPRRLQWGRGHVTAEVVIDQLAQRVPPPLQWGRGHVTAEVGQEDQQALTGNLRFNGAAVM